MNPDSIPDRWWRQTVYIALACSGLALLCGLGIFLLAESGAPARIFAIPLSVAGPTIVLPVLLTLILAVARRRQMVVNLRSDVPEG